MVLTRALTVLPWVRVPCQAAYVDREGRAGQGRAVWRQGCVCVFTTSQAISRVKVEAIGSADSQWRVAIKSRAPLYLSGGL